MATGFDDILFAVFPDSDGYLPLPVGPDNGNEPRLYSCSVRLQNGTEASDLRGKRSVVTIQPAMGFTEGGTVVIEAGIGVRSLTYPTANNEELTKDAILVYFSPVGLLTRVDYRIELTFLVLEN